MGKIGKPQKSHKNNKIKAIDPFYKGPRTVDKNATKINQAPKRGDDEDMPRSLQNLIRLKNDTKMGKTETKKKRSKKAVFSGKGVEGERGMSRAVRSAPQFKQRRGESEYKFIGRMNRETQAVINKAQLEDKFDVDLDDSKDGKIKREKAAPSEKKRQRLKDRKAKKKAKKGSKETDHHAFEHLTDKVEFGEVAMAPPSLTAQPRKVKDVKTNRPGTKSLLLKEVLKTQATSEASRQPGQTIKRKDMSLAKQRIMDAERERVIEMYRAMKKKQSPRD